MAIVDQIIREYPLRKYKYLAIIKPMQAKKMPIIPKTMETQNGISLVQE